MKKYYEELEKSAQEILEVLNLGQFIAPTAQLIRMHVAVEHLQKDLEKSQNLRPDTKPEPHKYGQDKTGESAPTSESEVLRLIKRWLEEGATIQITDPKLPVLVKCTDGSWNGNMTISNLKTGATQMPVIR